MSSNQSEQTSMLGKAWMSHVVTLEKCGTPVLFSIIITLVILPIMRLSILQVTWMNYFSGEFPAWHVQGTFIFILSLSVGLFVQRLNRVSWRGLKRSARHLKKLEKVGVIDEKASREAFVWLLANCLLNHMGGDPQQPIKAAEIINSDFFQRFIDKLL